LLQECNAIEQTKAKKIQQPTPTLAIAFDVIKIDIGAYINQSGIFQKTDKRMLSNASKRSRSTL
jgi:hypothetical protein